MQTCVHSCTQTWPHRSTYLCAQLYRCVPLCGHVCVPVPPLLVTNLDLKVHIHACMLIWLPTSAPPLCLIVHKHMHPCVAPHSFPSHPSSGDILWLECVHTSVLVCMLSYSPLPLNSYVKQVYHCAHVPITSLPFSHLGWNLYMHQNTYACPHDSHIYSTLFT